MDFSKNKPVAYMSKNGTLFKEEPPAMTDLIPLYTEESMHQFYESEYLKMATKTGEEK